ncbi:MAG: hypothetical protein PSV22_11655 [Pseudolabrys sp.]|nr:hypothetical protein [Pseudolabrys sp.]
MDNIRCAKRIGLDSLGARGLVDRKDDLAAARPVLEPLLDLVDASAVAQVDVEDLKLAGRGILEERKRHNSEFEDVTEIALDRIDAAAGVVKNREPMHHLSHDPDGAFLAVPESRLSPISRFLAEEFQKRK